MKFDPQVTQLMCVLQEALRPENQQHLPAIVEQAGLDKVLDPELFKATRYHERRGLLFLLATLGLENTDDTAHYQRWLAVTQYLSQQLDAEETVRLCAAGRPLMVPFYQDLLKALSQPAKDATPVDWVACPCQEDDLLFATEILLDHHAVQWLPAVLARWRQLDTRGEPWLWMCRTVIERIPFALRAQKAEALAQALNMLLGQVQAPHQNLAQSLASHEVDLWLRAGQSEKAHVLAQALYERSPDMTHRYWLMRTHANRSEFSSALAHASSMLEALIDKAMQAPVERAEASTAVDTTPPKPGFDVQAANESLKTINRLLRERGLQPFLMSGVLLGYLREGQILPHDKDLDLGLIGWQSQFEVAQALLASGQYQVSWRRLRGAQTFLLDVVDLKYGVAIDFFFFHPNGDHFLHGIDYKYGFTQNFKFSNFALKEVDFLGERFWIPDNADQNLTENYGDWRTPQSSYVVTVESPALMDKGSDKHMFILLIELMRSVKTFHSVKRVQRILACAQELGIDPLSDNLRCRLDKWQARQALH
jgi:hypothetical protein